MTSTTTQQRIEKLITAAMKDAASACFGEGLAKDGRFWLFAIPVHQRTRPMRDHFRLAFYLHDGTRIHRMNRADFEKAMEADPF
ncbi:MAG: hypothetical protein ABSC08_02490 [Bryobacteraceae bacterium]|jgi:hypothetical protein